MKIEFVQISNLLSFPYCANIEDAEKIAFNSGLNIIIGENGSGKSTALEVINFLFKRVLYRQYNVNQDLFSKRTTLSADDRRQILQPANLTSYSGFRLDPNWDSEDQQQKIRLEVKLDDIDQHNLDNLRTNYEKLKRTALYFSTHAVEDDGKNQETYILDIILNMQTQQFDVQFQNSTQDFGLLYLSEYNFFKEAISLHNFLNPRDTVPPLYESFTIISSYRNYHAFEPSVTLKDQHPLQQIQSIRNKDYSKSLNTSDKSEPAVFGLVRLQVADKHFDLISEKLTEKECEERANTLPFLLSINEKLKVVNLRCSIRLIEKRTWQYNFEITDLRRNKLISDINSLSAGQKAIIHLVFEAYGRGDLKGGVVVIDEPENHLHYQFQNEYMRVINDLNRDQNCQYILVTHSEALINSSTINNVRRFSLSELGHTKINAPSLNTDQKNLIKILDNMRTTYAFFAKTVILVEGDTDRYFFKSAIQNLYPHLDQEVAILYMGGKGGYDEWNKLFSDFGLTVYFISDFDFIVNRHYPSEKGTPLRTRDAVTAFKARHPDWEQKIEQEYQNGVFILKNGDLERYLGISKGLAKTIKFCNQYLDIFLRDKASNERNEICKIMADIAK